MFGARSIGFGNGMLVGARNSAQNFTWIRALIEIQATDWVATIAYSATGTWWTSQRRPKRKSGSGLRAGT